MESALKKSIEKYFRFYKKGGDVGFIPPDAKDAEQSSDSDDQKLIEKISEDREENRRLAELIEEVRSSQNEILQISSSQQ